jgi:hypothetical protein
MASKQALIAAVGLVSTLSVVSGTFLAYRANQTATPVIEATATATPEPVVPAPAPDAMISVAPPMVSHPPAAEPQSQSQKPAVSAGTRREKAEASGSRPTTTPSPRADNAPAPQPAWTPAPTPALPPEPTPAAAATAAAVVEAPPVLETPKPRFEEVVVKQDSVVGIQIDHSVSSETAKIEDRVTAKVTRDVTVDGRTAIAAGTKLEGVVSLVERGGKFRERARIGVRFNTMILPDGLRLPIQTDAILREGDSPAGEATAKIGGSAVAGAIVGGLIGGKRGAAIGTAAAAAGATAVVASGGRNAAVIQSGSPLTVRLTAPVTVTIEREFSGR